MKPLVSAKNTKEQLFLCVQVKIAHIQWPYVISVSVQKFTNKKVLTTSHYRYWELVVLEQNKNKTHLMLSKLFMVLQKNNLVISLGIKKSIPTSLVYKTNQSPRNLKKKQMR